VKQVGVRLREERKKLGLTQQEFASLGGIATNAQAHYEAGERQPKAGYLIGIAAGGVDILYVLLGTRTPTPQDSLSAEEAQIILQYRSLPNEDRSALGQLSTSLSNCN
jgi:transcriptional regulator with XRE-family HTH domain